jgi:2-polyprenyl-6-hydroxyphenyl methylase/3-demethylubiquinone-9 3-methyltransferase
MDDSLRVVYRDARSGAEYLAEYAALMDEPTNRLRIRTVLEHLPTVLGQGGRVLDVACGGGAYLHAWTRGGRTNGFQAYGLDREPNCVWGFRRAVPGARVVVADAAKPPFQSGAFDVVLAMDIIEHLENDSTFLDELRRMLRPGGWLLVFTQNSLSLENLVGSLTSPLRGRKWVGWDPTHRRFYTSRGLSRLLAQAGFEVCALDGTYYLPFHLPARLAEVGLARARRPGLGRAVGRTIQAALYALNYPFERYSPTFPWKHFGWGLLVVARRVE